MNRAKAIALVLALLAVAPGASAQNAGTRDLALVRVRYIVNDVPASVTFYIKLGFKLDAQSGPYFAALSRGGVQLLLSPTTGPGGASQPCRTATSLRREAAGRAWFSIHST